MKKKNLWFILPLFLLSLLLTSCGAASKIDFVTVKDGQLFYQGKAFRFMGTNNYYLHYESNAMIDDVIHNAKEMGLKVIRLWAFFNGNGSANKDHNAYMQPKPGVYGPPKDLQGAKDCYERLDYTVAQAQKAGIKVVLVLNNNWDDFGGANTYVEWAGKKGHDLFYTDERVKTIYKDYVKNLANRKNTYSNVLYKNDPTVMTWELMNEPRCESDQSGETLVKWVTEMSAYVKSVAPNQLVAVGDEGFFNRKDGEGFDKEGNWAYNGFSGVDWERLVAVKDVDYGTFHLYPEGWGINTAVVEQWGTQYILDHLEAGKKLGKPVVLEEYGINSAGTGNRLAIYDIWNKTMAENGGAGSMFWILTGINDKESKDNGADGIYDDYDGFRVMNDKTPVPELLKRYSAWFNDQMPVSGERAYLVAPAKAQEVQGTYKIKVKVIPATEQVKAVEGFVNGQSIGKLSYSKMKDDYDIRWDTLAQKDGEEVGIKAIVTFESGKTLETEEVKVTVSNVVNYAVLKELDFSNNICGAVSEGAYQAELKAVKHTGLNGGMIEADASTPGKFEWEELKVKLPAPNYPELKNTSKISFTLYFEKALADTSGATVDTAKKAPGTNPYIAMEPGWNKKALNEHAKSLNELEIVKLEDGKEYYMQKVEIAFFKNDSYTGFAICPVFNQIKYSGPVYIDDVVFYQKQ
ncbi:MAG: cellulase family glycosylhydrolase [Clostridia bacterium]|nr:cellulase family glycosylhydrolase [Clostridia bacterium]